MQEKIQSLVQVFFEKLGADFSDIKIEEESENIFRITLKSDDSHLLIGPHGKNLETLSHLLKLIISKHFEDHIHIHVEINDYLAKKDEKLKNFIETKIKYVQDSGKEIILPFFTAYERKKIHSYVSEHGGSVYTHSVGEGSERRIHLCRKDEKMTIDIDGDDI